MYALIYALALTNGLKKAADKLIKLWDAYTGQILRTFEGHKEGISDIAWSKDGEYLASASDDKTIKIWSMEFVSLRVCSCVLRLMS